MKKLISLLLSVLLAFSFVTVSVSALDLNSLKQDAENSFINGLSGGLSASVNIDDGSDIQGMLDAGTLDNVDMLGMTIDFLYHSTDTLIWPTLTVTKSDMTLAKANINTYLATALETLIGDYENVKFCTAANATKIANFIGHVLDPDFEDVVISDLSVENTGFYYDSFDTVNVFYTKIARYSGLTEKIQTNWIDANVNFSPVLYILGFDFNDDQMLGKSKLSDAERIAPVLVKSVFKSVCQQGPLEYVLRLVASVSATYGACTYVPIKALLQAHISKGKITAEEFGTIRGLLNTVVNAGAKSEATKIQFTSAPVYRFASCVDVGNIDTTNMFLYTLIYLTLVGKHSNNRVAITSFEDTYIKNNFQLSADQRKVISSIIDGIFLNNLTDLVSNMSTMFNNNVDQVGTTIGKTLINILKTYFENILRFFNKFFDSIAHFGDF